MQWDKSAMGKNEMGQKCIEATMQWEKNAMAKTKELEQQRRGTTL